MLKLFQGIIFIPACIAVATVIIIWILGDFILRLTEKPEGYKIQPEKQE